MPDKYPNMDELNELFPDLIPPFVKIRFPLVLISLVAFTVVAYTGSEVVPPYKQ